MDDQTMGNTVRAKFECISAEPHTTSLWDETHQTHLGEGTAYQYKFQAVTGGSPENDKFFASTPGGYIDLYAVRADLFKRGQTYYIDFTPTV